MPADPAAKESDATRLLVQYFEQAPVAGLLGMVDRRHAPVAHGRVVHAELLHQADAWEVATDHGKQGHRHVASPDRRRWPGAELKQATRSRVIRFLQRVG